MVRNKKALRMMDWRNAWCVEKMSMSLNLCTRAYLLAVDIRFNATKWISSDVDKDDYSMAAKATTKNRRRQQPGQANAKGPKNLDLRHMAATPRQ
jgi:hypothetical protein